QAALDPVLRDGQIEAGEILRAMFANLGAGDVVIIADGANHSQGSGVRGSGVRGQGSGVRSQGMGILLTPDPLTRDSYSTTQVSSLANRSSSLPRPLDLMTSFIWVLSVSSKVGRSTARRTPITSGNSG